jgi:hypothetical protein
MPTHPDKAIGTSTSLRSGRRELWIAVLLAVVAIVAATVEYGRPMGIAVLAVILGLGIHVRLFLSIGVIIGRFRSGLPVRELAICVVLAGSALLLHSLSPVPLGHVAGISAVIALLIFFAKKMRARAGG